MRTINYMIYYYMGIPHLTDFHFLGDEHNMCEGTQFGPGTPSTHQRPGSTLNPLQEKAAVLHLVPLGNLLALRRIIEFHPILGQPVS